VSKQPLQAWGSITGCQASERRSCHPAANITVDEQFIENTRNGSIPEERFRFVNKCVENGCRQWTGTRCGIADTIENACRICPYVITEITETEVNEFFEDEKNIVLRVDV